MSENKFTEHMEVEKIGTLKPGDIGWGTCDGCEKNIYKFPGVLIQGITEEAAKLLYEKVEIVPEGTKERLEKLEARNAELLETLENDLLRKRVLELEEMLKQSMHNNDELRNDNYQLRARVEELERQVQDYKEENVKLLQQCLALYRAVKKANCELDKIEESCDNNVWFSQLKERTY
jgi:chromosome segregation ATPase